MIRPFTCVCLVLAAGSGLYLYQVKQRAFALDASLRSTFHGIDVARERTRMLRADWALMNDPERLQALASEYLHLQPMQPSQLMTMDQLAAALPPPVAPQAAPASAPNGSVPDAAKTAPAIDPTHGVPMAAATPPATTPGHTPRPQVALLAPAAPDAISSVPLPPPAAPAAAQMSAASEAAASAAAPPAAAMPAVAVVETPLAKPAPAPVARPTHHWVRHPAPAGQAQPSLAAASPQPDRQRRPHRHEGAPVQLYASNAPAHMAEPAPRFIPRAATVMYSPSAGSSLGMASSATLAPPRPLYSTSQ